MSFYRKSKFPKNSLYRIKKGTTTGYLLVQAGTSSTFVTDKTSVLRHRYRTEQVAGHPLSTVLEITLPTAFLEGR